MRRFIELVDRTPWWVLVAWLCAPLVGALIYVGIH